MRLRTPRIEPVDLERLDDEQHAVLDPIPEGSKLNILRTLAHSPGALSGFLGWANYVLSRRNSLSPRDRELAILRIGWLCRSGYEFVQHVRIARRAGLADQEIARVKQGPGAPGWTAAERALLQAVDQLHADQHVDDPTWTALQIHFDQRALMDLVFTVAQYTQVSMILNTFGVQLDEGLELDPDLALF